VKDMRSNFCRGGWRIGESQKLAEILSRLFPGDPLILGKAGSTTDKSP